VLKDRLSSLRSQSKMTQSEASKKLGIARTTYAGYENGSRRPDPETLDKLADIFNVSTDYLLGRTDDPSPLKETTMVLDTNLILDLFSKRLQKHRLEKGYTYDQLAEKVGVVNETVEKYETSPSSIPGQRTLNRLSDALGVTRDYLLGYTDDPKGYGKGVYETDSRDLKKFMDQTGPVMYDGMVVEGEDAREKLDLLIRQAFFMVGEQNKKEAANRKKKSD
jgi:transcriptional regulator with XRE-family HTH domain